MTRYTATVTAGDAEASSAFTVTDGRGSLVGAHLVPYGTETMPEAITAFEALTNRPLLARRHDYGGDIPVSALSADVALDAGLARKSLLTFRPGKRCTPTLMRRFLGECKELGLVIDITLWPEMHRFIPPIQYRTLCELYVPVIHEHGYTHTFAVTNYAAIMRDAMAEYWPGDDMADAVQVVFYPSGLSLDIPAGFADDHQVPFGLAEFGVDLDRVDVADGATFMEYVHRFFATRIGQGKPNSDLVYFNGVRDGNYLLGRARQLVRAYQHMFDTLIT